MIEIPRKALRFVERLAPKHRSRAAEEGRVPLVEAALDDAVEHLVFGRHLLERPEIALERVRVEEEVRCLDEEQTLVLAKIADRLAQERPGGRVVGVEDGNQLARRMFEPVVEIARLGVLVARPRQVARAQFLAKLLQLDVATLGHLRVDDAVGIALLLRAAIIQQPDGETVGGIVHRLGRRDRVGEQDRVLVVGGDEDIDGRQDLLFDARGRSRAERPGDDEQAEKQHEHAVHLGKVEQQAGNEVLELGDRRKGARRAPVDIAQHDRGSKGERDQAPCPVGAEQLEDHHQDDDDRPGDEMRLQVDRKRDDEQDAGCGGDPHDCKGKLDHL